MVRMTVYVEGAGPTELQRSQCRRAFQAFFTAAGLSGKLPRVVACGGRDSTYQDFVTAVATAKPDEIPLLLVDSEDAVTDGHTAWQHLQARDGWTQPADTTDDQAFLMVRVMETWFLADLEMLKRHFGKGFRENAIKKWPNLEDVPKATVFDALEKATSPCQRKYGKGKISFELLEKLDPHKLERACPRAKGFLDRLRNS